MKLHYLQHSGFMLETSNRAYIFDYYKDPTGEVKRAQSMGKELWFFVTHWHHDHYVPEILNFNSPTTRYIVHEDVPHDQMPTERTTIMKVGDELRVADIPVKMYGSTDEGGSFWLQIGAARIFHAGDLNWWHWLGDTVENNRFAKEFAEREFARLNGMEADLVMFPVDARLEEAREWGAIEFLHVVPQPKLFVPMHSNGPAWVPSTYFKALYGELTIWTPKASGDGVELSRYDIK